MARRTSYNPNTALIAGEARARKYQSGFAAEGAAAFTKGFLTTYEAGMKEKEEREAKMQSYMTALGSIGNINMLDDGYNKQAVTNFVREKRDEYAELAGIYEKTKDPEVMDRMNNIKFSFANLNNQLKGLVEERKMYADTYDKDQLVVIGNGDEKYTDIYTNKGDFSIETNGDIGFTSNGEYNKFTDIAGKWNVKNNISETLTLKTNLDVKGIGAKGGDFYRDDIKNNYVANFKQTGKEGIMVMAKTDITGDNEYTLHNGAKAGNLSFESMWSQGLLADKFYTEFKPKNGNDWMWDEANSDKLNNLMSEYYTDVSEASFEQGKANYNRKGGKGGKKENSSSINKAIQLTNGQYMQAGTARTIKSNLEKGISFKWDGVDYKYQDGKWQTPEGVVGNGTADDIVYNITNDPAFQGIKTEKKIFVNNKGQTVEGNQEEFAEGMVSSIPGLKNIVNVNALGKDDSAVASSLNKVMPTTFSNANPKGYKWDITRFAGIGNFYEDAITLKDGQGNVVTYPDGHEFANQEVVISLSQSDNPIQYIDDVFETFGLSENIKNTSLSPTSGGGKLLDE